MVGRAADLLERHEPLHHPPTWLSDRPDQHVEQTVEDGTAIGLASEVRDVGICPFRRRR